MLNLILTIVCSTTISLIIKNNDVKQGHPLVLLMGNYLTAALIGFLFYLLDRPSAFSIQTLLFGMLLAFLFVYAFFAFTQAVKTAGTALATVSSRLSVVIPILFSIIIFHEKPGLQQLIGFGFALLTLYTFYLSLKQKDTEPFTVSKYFYLFTVLLGIGTADFCMKLFREWRPIIEKSFFLFCIFLFSFLYLALFIRMKKIPIRRNVFFAGLGLGIPNILSTFFLLDALTHLPGILVYPMVNIGIILLTTVGAGLIWHEKLNRYGKIALMLGLASILLIGTGLF